MFKTLQRKKVEEIHSAFDNAQSELLVEANRIINEYNNSQVIISEKAVLLNQLGFKKNKQAVVYNSIIKDLEVKESVVNKSKNFAALINYYSTEYPFLKFLTEDKLDIICKKYKLIYAPVGNYKEDVPIKNLLEIKNAKPLLEKDIVKPATYIKCMSVRSETPSWVFNVMKDVWVEYKKSDMTNFDKYFADYMIGLGHSNVDKNWFWTNIETSIKTVDKSGLFIAAPKSHFDLNGLGEEKNGFFSVTIFEPKDPIVFRYVRGGIQVLTKWGLEANDADLAVGILN